MGLGKSLWVKTWRKWGLLSKGAYFASRWEEVAGSSIETRSPKSVLCPQQVLSGWHEWLNAWFQIGILNLTLYSPLLRQCPQHVFTRPHLGDLSSENQYKQNSKCPNKCYYWTRGSKSLAYNKPSPTSNLNKIQLPQNAYSLFIQCEHLLCVRNSNKSFDEGMH